MEDIYSIVCSFEKVRTHLDERPQDKKKIIKFIDEIKCEYSLKTVKSLEKFIDKTFLKLYDGFNLETQPGFNLEETLKTHHVILCPNHQSHADYLAMSYILYKRFKLPVFIAAGINLNIFPIGKIFRKSGAFFIRRRFDDELYKLAFQGYIYYMLKTDKVVEFFFEGGRTRTGKLLPPRFGLFSMILDAHMKFDKEGKKPLMFIPISIAHEHIPEERAHEKEVKGAKKQKEKSTELLKIFKLFSKKLGTVHVNFGEGIVVNDVLDLKLDTRKLAFRTFRTVGQNMPVTPTSLLALIFLDDPAGALTWKQVEKKAENILEYCEMMGIPKTKSLCMNEYSSSLKVAMDLALNNDKVLLVKREKLNQIFYKITEEARVQLLFHKNMIVHHFFVPVVINATWFNLFCGNFKTGWDLKKYLLIKRKELKYEFYLPDTKVMIEEGLKIIGHAVGREIKHVDDVLELEKDDLYKVGSYIRNFSSSLNYIYEAYYLSAITIKYLSDNAFTQGQFIEMAEELFTMEKEHGRVIRYYETYTVPNMEATLEYMINKGVLARSEETEKYIVINETKIGELIEKFAKDVNDQVAFNLKMDHSNE